MTYTVTAQNGTTKTYTVTVQSYQSWTYSGSLVHPDHPGGRQPAGLGRRGNQLPAARSAQLRQLHLRQAQPDGRDIRFATAAGATLSYQIEQWDAANGSAAVWVKIPTITGNARQEIKMYWGKTGVTSESSGTAVFNAANGYASVSCT